MDKNSLIKKLLQKKETKDYTYVFLFFFISSFFLIFAIKPALTIAFSLKRQAEDLTRINTLYENNLAKLVDVQQNLENVRDKIGLLDEAAPHLPETKTLIDDIKQSASQEGILIKQLNLSTVDLKNESTSNDLKVLSMTMETDAGYTSIDGFINDILNQRRIKTIKNLKIFQDDTVSSNSSTLRVVLEIDGYYL